MFRLQLFRIRAFTAGVFASFLAALSRGGLMFMLVIWLQGIWLPRHGYDFARTPLWAGIAMLPLTARPADRRADLGCALGPLRCPALRHRRHARPPPCASPCSSCCRSTSPTGSSGRLLFVTGLVAWRRSGPPTAPGVMNSLPAEHRGAGSGMNTTFQNSAQVFSIGIFFTLMIVGLSSTLTREPVPRAWSTHGVPAADGHRARAHLPPVSTLFAAFLGYNPIQHLVGAATLAHLDARPTGPTCSATASSPRSSPPPFRRACTPPSTSPSWPACVGAGGVVDPRRALRLRRRTPKERSTSRTGRPRRRRRSSRRRRGSVAGSVAPRAPWPTVADAGDGRGAP